MQFKQENEKIKNEITLIKNERVLIQQQLKKLKEKYDKKEKELRDLYNEKLKKIEELEHKKVYKVKISFLNGDNDIITIKYNDLNSIKEEIEKKYGYKNIDIFDLDDEKLYNYKNYQDKEGNYENLLITIKSIDDVILEKIKKYSDDEKFYTLTENDKTLKVGNKLIPFEVLEINNDFIILEKKYMDKYDFENRNITTEDIKYEIIRRTPKFAVFQERFMGVLRGHQLKKKVLTNINDLNIETLKHGYEYFGVSNEIKDDINYFVIKK